MKKIKIKDNVNVNVLNKFRGNPVAVASQCHCQSPGPGRMKNSSHYIAPVGVRTHDLPHTAASNMVKVSYALTREGHTCGGKSCAVVPWQCQCADCGCEIFVIVERCELASV